MTDRRTVLKGLVAAPALLAVGCAQRMSTTPAGVLNVGQTSNSVAFFPLFVAEKNGYFTDEGITLGDRPRLGTGAKLAAAVKSGSIDIGAGVITDAFNLAKIDDGTRMITSLTTEFYVDIVVAHSFAGPGDDASLKDKAKALVGRTIGITGPASGTEALVKHLFTVIGKNAATDSTLVNLGSVATAALGALKAGRVEALAFFQPIAQQAEAAGIGRTYVSPARGDVPGLRGVLHGVTFSTRRLLDRKKKELAGFQRAMGRALADIHGDADEARALLGAYLKASSPTALDALMPILLKETPTRPDLDEKAYDKAVTFHLDSGLIRKAPAYADVIPEEFRN